MADDWAIVKIVGTDEEAELIAGFLRSREVPVEVESLLFHQEPVTFGRLGEVRIRVPADCEAEAIRLLDEAAAEPPAPEPPDVEPPDLEASPDDGATEP